MFSKTCEYGIRAAIFIAAESYQDKSIRLKEHCQKIDSPECFYRQKSHKSWPETKLSIP